MPRVCLMGVNYDTGNYGVRVLLSGAVEALATTIPNTEVAILDYGYSPAKWTESLPAQEPTSLELIDLRFTWRAYLPNNVFSLLCFACLARLIPVRRLREVILGCNQRLKAVLRADACLSLAGGDSFSDIYGFYRFLYATVGQILVIVMGRPLILLPQTYGPFKSVLAKRIARFICRRAKLIYSRDLEGLSTVELLVKGATSKTQYVPDLGFAMTPEPVGDEIVEQFRQWKKSGVLVGFNISRLLYMGGYTRRNMFGLREDYPVLVRKILGFLAEEVEAQVLLVPHVGGESESLESERVLCRQINRDMHDKYPDRIHYIDEDLNHKQMKTVIGQCDVFVGSRMHACIAAVSQCVPTLGLSYSLKFAGVMKSVGCGVRVVELRTTNAESVCRAIQQVVEQREGWRQCLQLRMPIMREEVLAMFRSATFRQYLTQPVTRLA